MPSYLSVLESILFCDKPKRKVWTYDQLMDEIAMRHPSMKNRRLMFEAVATLKEQGRVWDTRFWSIQTFPHPPPPGPKKPKVKKPCTISPEQLAINVAASQARRDAVKAAWWAKEDARFLGFYEACYVHEGYWKTRSAVLHRVTRVERRRIARLVSDGRLTHVATPCCGIFTVPTDQLDRIQVAIPDLDLSTEKARVERLLAEPERWIEKRDALNVLIEKIEQTKCHQPLEHLLY